MEQKLLEQTYQLIDAIKNREDYKALIILDQKIKDDEELTYLIEQFNDSKIKYDEVRKYGKYHPDLKTVKKQFQVDKVNLFSHEHIKAYKAAEKSLQAFLDEVAYRLGKTVSDSVKTSTNLEFHERGGFTCSNENV